MQHNADAFLTEMAARLKAAGIATARLDSLILLEDVTGRNRAHLLAHPELELTKTQQNALEALLLEREKHIPLAYLRKKAYFYGREFIIDEYVLVPRPETEAMVDMLKQLPLQQPHIADIGTGSGCIGISAALELPSAAVFLCDIDEAALEIAGKNNMALHAHARLVQSDLLAVVQQPLDVVMANLPYVPDAFPINKAAAHEPAIALFAGEDGLDAYRALWSQLKARTDKPRYVLTESLPVQHARLAAYAQPAGYNQRAVDGFIQLFVRAA